MFVDEKKLGESQTDTRSDLERFIAWAKTRHPHETYLFNDPENCLIARWQKSEGKYLRALRSTEVFALFEGCGREVVLYDAGDWGTLRTAGGALAAAERVQGET